MIGRAANTPRPIIDRLNKDCEAALAEQMTFVDGLPPSDAEQLESRLKKRERLTDEEPMVVSRALSNQLGVKDE